MTEKIKELLPHIQDLTILRLKKTTVSIWIFVLVSKS